MKDKVVVLILCFVVKNKTNKKFLKFRVFMSSFGIKSGDLELNRPREGWSFHVKSSGAHATKCSMRIRGEALLR